MQVTALYDYEPEEPDELGFQEGDILRVLRVQEDGWWAGYDVQNPDVVGLFPSNYVQTQRSADSIQNNSRQRSQLQLRKRIDTPEEEDEKVSESHGHIGTVLQLRQQLKNAERASEAVHNARQQAERERLKYQRSWREREKDEEDIKSEVYQEYHQQQETHSEDEDEELMYRISQRRDQILENDRLEEGTESEKSHDEEQYETQSEVKAAEIETAAATLIARGFKLHSALIQRKREAEQQHLSEIAVVCIQRWAEYTHSRRRQRETDQSIARRRLKRENEAAREIQKWIHLRWASFWRRRLEFEKEKCTQQTFQSGEEKTECQLKTTEEEETRLVKEKKCQEEENRRELQLKAVEEDVQVQFLRLQEENGGQQKREDPTVSSVLLPDKPRRKVMKKEAVELIRTLVQQQLGEMLRDHDEKMDELQRMVVRLQIVVRKQTAMLEDSTNQLVNLQMTQQDKRLKTINSSLPKVHVGGNSSVHRQPVHPSGLRVPRPVVWSKLPELTSNGRRPSCNQGRKMG